MSEMNIPDDTAFKLLDWAWTGLLAGVAFVWRHLAGQHKELREETMHHIEELRQAQDKRANGLASEVERQRDVAAKIFDKLEAMSKESADRHERLLTALHVGLAGKADK